MINILKKEIEKKIGKKITNRGDCELVSNVILETIEEDISYSTIRRLYGLDNHTKPNNNTLNTLSKFIGYKNYIHFSQNYRFKEKINLTQKIYEIVAEEDEDKIIYVVTKYKYSSEDFVSLIISLTRELLHNENYILIDKVFKLESLKFNSFSYSEVLHLGNSIGLLLRKKNKINPILFSNINFLDCVYLTFVDYSSLNTYYGDWSEIILQKKINSDTNLFSSAIIEFKNFLNLKPIYKFDDKIIQDKQLHPILSGRLLALKLLSTEPNKIIHTLEMYYQTSKRKSNLINSGYELFMIAILTKNTQIMSYLIENISLKIEYYYQRSHVNLYFLMCLFYFNLTHDIKNEKKIIKLFRPDDFQYSYKEFIRLIHYIYVFNKASKKVKKDSIKHKYLKLSRKLNYTFFSENFLVNYFN